MDGKKVIKLASRGRRFAAAVIDIVPHWILLIAIFGSMVVWIVEVIARSVNSVYYGYSYTPYASAGAGLILTVLCLAYLGVQLYFFSRSQSIGKAILGLRVVSSKDGQPIGFWRMVLRDLIVKRASEVVCYLGYIWILIDDRNRGWHDKIMDTYVVDDRPEMAPQGQSYKTYTDPDSAVSVAPTDDPCSDTVSYTVHAQDLVQRDPARSDADREGL